MLKKTDPKIYKLIKQEQKRQAESIRLIPSENYVSKAVLEATGSILTNKYSEGYARKRYYEGQEFVDQIEEEAILRAKNLFLADHVNIQPYSGSPANLAVYFAFLKPGEKVMGMSLPHGGHLTHGWKVSASAKFFNTCQYVVDEKTKLINYDAILAQAKKERPQIIVAGATAYPRKIDFKKFKEIADIVGAYFLADIAHISGLIVAGLHQSPVPYADCVTTTTHKSLRGPRGAIILCKERYAKAIDRAVFPGLQGGPHDNTTAAIAVALKEASTAKFKNYAKQVIKNAQTLAKELLKYNFDLVTGGTDNHLILIDMTNKKLSGKQMSVALISAGIECNANTVPYDKRSPFDPSGIRVGTPAVTTLGMKEEEMKQIALWMNKVSENVNNERVLSRIKHEVKKLCGRFEMPGIN